MARQFLNHTPKDYWSDDNTPVNMMGQITNTTVNMMGQITCYGNVNYWQLNDFELGHVVGKGKFGTVVVAREKTSHFIVALKIMDKSTLEKESMQKQVMREIEIQSFLRHPRIISLYTYFMTQDQVFLVLEFAHNGSLYQYMKNHRDGRLPEDLTARYMYQIADAVDYCHRNCVLHRDIKPENILLDMNYDLKLSDFGWSVWISKEGNHRRQTLCGTLDYVPPEIVENREYGMTMDNWCIGVLCYELLTGYPPFHCYSEDDTLNKIASLDIQFPSLIRPGARDLIMSLLRHKPEERLPLSLVMQHYWVVNCMRRGVTFQNFYSR